MKKTGIVLHTGSLGVFILSPVFATFVAMAASCHPKRLKHVPEVLVVKCSLLFVFLQSNRSWQSEQVTDWDVGYASFFRESKFAGWADIFVVSEPLWLLMNKLGAVVFTSHYEFLTVIASATLLLGMISIYKFWAYSNRSSMILLSSIALFLLSTDFLAMLNNTVRSFFALSIVVYGLVRWITEGKKPTLILCAAVLVHNFSFLFLLAYSLGFLERRIDFKFFRLYFVAALFALVTFPAVVLLATIVDVSVIGNILGRISGGLTPMDQNAFDPNTVRAQSIAMGAVALASKIHSDYSFESRNPISNLLIILLLCSSILVAIMPEIAGRLFASRWFLIAFVLPYIEVRSNTISFLIQFSVVLFSVLNFTLSFDSSIGRDFFGPSSHYLTSSLVGWLE